MTRPLLIVLLCLALLPQRVSAAPPPISAPPPINPVVTTGGWVLTVPASGLYQFSRGALGVSAAQLPSLRLWRMVGGAAAEVALESSGDTLRFFADTPGDRWNTADRYWLQLGTGNGARVAARDVTPAGAAERDTALERGSWRDNRVYDISFAGQDRDHWFAARVSTFPGIPESAIPSVTVLLTPTLPLASGTAVLTVTGAARNANPAHQLRALAGGVSADAAASGIGEFALTYRLAADTSRLELRGVVGTAASTVLPGRVSYERPISLVFSGGPARFVGVSNPAIYRLSAVPADAALYDITDPLAPQRLTGAASSGTTWRFQDAGQRRYQLIAASAVPALTPQPYAAPAQPITAPQTSPAPDALYIAPAGFHAALAPLVAQRQRQGYRVQVVDVQALYDAWSFGQVSPEAIRSFLRYAAATWNPAPRAVTLVGDGTSDPLGFTVKTNPDYPLAGNPNILPPYLAEVDPWPFVGRLSEAACDTCYAQLNGTDPLDDTVPDLWLGRLPVKTPQQLAGLITKLLRYEQQDQRALWRSRALFLTDNAVLVEPESPNGTPDGAGDFFAEADAGAQLLAPSGADQWQIRKVYYDPWRASGTLTGQPWRIASSADVYTQAQAALGAGVGLMVYIGHGSPYQLGVTDFNTQPGTLHRLYDPRNYASNSAAIVVELSCLTAQFTNVNQIGTSVDEELLLASGGGAAAVWGPTGEGVAYDHAALLRGFVGELLKQPRGTAPIGSLVAAGQRTVLAQGSGADVVRTFVLLGDPLMPAQIGPGPAVRQSVLPMVRR